MLALKRGTPKPKTTTPSSGGVVLPRFLRKPVRMMSRIEWRLPRHAGLKGMAALFIATAIGGSVLGDHVGDLVGELTAKAGLAIHEVKITGQSETSELDVLQSLDLPSHASLLMLDLDAARDRVEKLPWVSQASLRKVYPDRLDITISERSGFALWRDGADVSIVDREGTVITPFTDARFAALPLVVGRNANRRAGEVVELLSGFPSLKPRVRAAVLVADRRWNLVLESGTEILLPEENPRAALDRLVIIDQDKALLSRDISRVDLRLPDRLVVRMTSEAATRRRAMLEQRLKNARKGGAA